MSSKKLPDLCSTNAQKCPQRCVGLCYILHVLTQSYSVARSLNAGSLENSVYSITIHMVTCVHVWYRDRIDVKSYIITGLKYS